MHKHVGVSLHLLYYKLVFSTFITLFRPIAVLCGTDNIIRNIQLECEEYSIKYYQSHTTMGMNNIMLTNYSQYSYMSLTFYFGKMVFSCDFFRGGFPPFI